MEKYTKHQLDNPELIETDYSSIKPPFGYYGAKQRIAKKIVELLPPHNAWVEVFCGSAAITLAKSPSPIEIINDLNSDIVNVFNQIRNNTEELIDVIEMTPYSREEFYKSRMINKKDSELEKARKFLVKSMMTVNGTIGGDLCGFSYSQSYERSGIEARVSRWNNLPDRILKVVSRLKKVRVEQLNAIKIIEMFNDRPATLMYLDPPYFVKRSHDYPTDQKEKQFHEELLELCCESKAMIMISNYDNRLYRTYLNRNTGWKRITIETHTSTTNGKKYPKKEIVWVNSKLVKAKEANRVPIRLSKKEKKQKKINPPRK